MAIPSWLASYQALGTSGGHTVLHLEDQIYAYWLEGHFALKHLQEMTRLIASRPGWERLYVSLAFTELIDGYDADLRQVMSDPGELRDRTAYEAVVVTPKPLERMIVRTMSLAGRAAGNPGGRLSAASTFEEGLARARDALREARAS